MGDRPAGVAAAARGDGGDAGGEGVRTVTWVRQWIRTHPTVLAVVFSAGLAWAGFQDLQAQTDRLEETRAEVLCPLYAVFLQSATPEARARAADPEVYDAAIDVIRDGARVLHCE